MSPVYWLGNWVKEVNDSAKTARVVSGRTWIRTHECQTPRSLFSSLKRFLLFQVRRQKYKKFSWAPVLDEGSLSLQGVFSISGWWSSWPGTSNFGSGIFTYWDMSLLAPKGICLFHLSLFKIVISVQCLKTHGLWAVTEPALTWWLPLPRVVMIQWL